MRQVLVGEGMERHVGSIARTNQENMRQIGLYTQIPQCFGKGHTSISPRMGRGDEHLMDSSLHYSGRTVILSLLLHHSSTNRSRKVDMNGLSRMGFATSDWGSCGTLGLTL